MAVPTDDLLDTLRSRVLRGLQAGTLRDGDRLPSAREVAGEFTIDHRMALTVYRQLAEEGLVDLRPRGGIYVAAPRSPQPSVPVPEEWIVDVLTAGFAREIPGPELHEWLRRCTDTLRLRAAVVATTHDQAAGLCRELHDDFGLEAEGMLATELEDGAPAPLGLRRADVLVTTEAHDERMRRWGGELRRPVIVVEVRPDLVAGEWSLLLRRPVYAVVATEEFGVMLRQFFAATPGVENLQIVVFGRDDLTTIPVDAPTYVTRRVRDILGGATIPGRILPPARTIATRSAREIFAFIVAANLEAMTLTRRER